MFATRCAAFPLFILGALCYPATAQTPRAPATNAYVGPGDASVAGTPLAFWSCDFAMTASYAASNGLACNLADAATRSVTYTMRFLPDGKADWAGAKASSACAKACVVSVMFDQVYVSTLPHPPSQPNQYATPSNLSGPPFAFNSIGAIPALVLDGSGNEWMQAQFAATQFQPYSFAWVSDGYDKRVRVLSSASTSVSMGFDADPTGLEVVAGGIFQTSMCSDAKLHTFIAVFSGTSSVLRCDATEMTHDAGTNHVQASETWTFFGGYKGRFGEAGYWGSGLTDAQRASLAANIKSRYGL
jgi:hypothetical protein